MTVLSVFLTRFQLMATQNTREWIDEKDDIIVDGESGLLKNQFLFISGNFFLKHLLFQSKKVRSERVKH